MLEETLEGFGYEVVSCEDGPQALEALTAERSPEIAILDWMMPGMDGVEVCRHLRQSPTNSTYVILLTVRSKREDLLEGLQAGADDYIIKPFDPEELRARIRVGQRIVDLQRRRIEQETAFYIQQLEQTVQELHESRSRIVAAQEDLRRAIAEELHGRVQTQMCLLYLRLLDIREKITSEPEAAQTELAQAASELDALREEEVRQLSHRLHPSVIKISLASGLRSLCEQFERHIPVTLEISKEAENLEPPGGSDIPPSVRLGLYRVAEEALGNVVKHARATRASVRLWADKTARVIYLSVEDDGQGFVVSDASRKSLGLTTMQDYMGAIGGSFAVHSVPGSGTGITAAVSLGSDEQEG